MSNTTLNTRIVICSKTSSEWAQSANSSLVPLRGEFCVETFTDSAPKIKIGDGVTTWINLPYATLTPAEVQTMITTGAYTLPVATSSTIGGVLSGTDITVDSSGNVSVNDNSHNHTMANVTGLQDALDDKVTIVDGKDLSTNDFSDMYKAKVDATNIAYGTCSTAAGTAAKEINLVGNTNWSLVAGSMITIKFDASNTANNPTFNVAGTGAKKVWYNTALITTANLTMAGSANRPMNFMYDGTQYVFIGWSYDNNTTYAPYTFGMGYGVQNNSSAATAITATLSNYTLATGGVVAVRFTYDVPANATLNINGKGAKSIYYNTAAITAGVIKAGDIATFVYSTYYYLLSVDRWSKSVADITRTGDSNTFTATREDGTTFTFTQRDTTYTFDSGDDNGQIKVTPSVGDAVNVSVTGLKSAAYTEASAFATSAQGTKADNAMPKSGGTFTGAVTLNADPTADLGAATKQYVDNQITTKIAAADAMVFKGTLGTGGTVTAVPTTNVVKGDTYKIITAGTWAGHTGCKVGDLLIALNSGALTANTTNWAYVPSGDEATTSIKYSTTTQNLTTSAQTGAITVGEAATKQVDTSITEGTASTNLPTTKSVSDFVTSRGYVKNNDKVKQTSSTTNSAYPLLASASTSPTSGSADYSIYNTGITVNMSTKTLNASEFNGSLNANHLYQTSGEFLILDGNFS